MSVKGDVIKAGGRVTPRAALKMRGHSVQSQSLTVPMRGDTQHHDIQQEKIVQSGTVTACEGVFMYGNTCSALLAGLEGMEQQTPLLYWAA